jgi:hypothetical protein
MHKATPCSVLHHNALQFLHHARSSQLRRTEVNRFCGRVEAAPRHSANSHCHHTTHTQAATRLRMCSHPDAEQQQQQQQHTAHSIQHTARSTQHAAKRVPDVMGFFSA